MLVLIWFALMFLVVMFFLLAMMELVWKQPEWMTHRWKRSMQYKHRRASFPVLGRKK